MFYLFFIIEIVFNAATYADLSDQKCTSLAKVLSNFDIIFLLPITEVIGKPLPSAFPKIARSGKIYILNVSRLMFL